MESSDELQSSIYVFNPVVTVDNYYNYELNLAITPLSGFTQKKITLSKNVVGAIFWYLCQCLTLMPDQDGWPVIT